MRAGSRSKRMIASFRGMSNSYNVTIRGSGPIDAYLDKQEKRRQKFQATLTKRKKVTLPSFKLPEYEP